MVNKIKSIEARVIFKAMDIINGNACHFITFEELDTKERVYLQVGMGNYMMILEGDSGVIHYKEQKKRYKNKFISFERSVYAARQESSVVETYHQEDVGVIDENMIVVLEAENPIACEDSKVEIEASEEPAVPENSEAEIEASEEPAAPEDSEAEIEASEEPAAPENSEAEIEVSEEPTVPENNETEMKASEEPAAPEDSEAEIEASEEPAVLEDSESEVIANSKKKKKK